MEEGRIISISGFELAPFRHLDFILQRCIKCPVSGDMLYPCSRFPYNFLCPLHFFPKVNSFRLGQLWNTIYLLGIKYPSLGDDRLCQFDLYFNWLPFFICDGFPVFIPLRDEFMGLYKLNGHALSPFLHLPALCLSLFKRGPTGIGIRTEKM